MKIYLIEKTEYNGAYGTVNYKHILEAYIDKDVAKDIVDKHESKIYTNPTYFKIKELELIEGTKQ